MAFKESPSQTAGPYVHIGCMPQTAGLEARQFGPQLGASMVDGETPTITLDLTILDGSGELIRDALVEIWQADPDGSYVPSERFRCWARQATDLTTGRARFETIKPGSTAEEAPHILVWIAARGINLGLTTRIYFPDENNSHDPVFVLAGTRAETLVATKSDTGYVHTIRLQGADETVFFDV